MSTRQRVPSRVEASVLLHSKRRCCLCVYLSGDSSQKRGQIAHLDGDPDNNDEDNLAFLCLEHHDQYDSRASVSKGLTIAEVKRYRQKLHTSLDTANAPAVYTPASGSAAARGHIKVEPFFWLAQTLVAWFTSRMELSWQILEAHATSLSVDVKPFSRPAADGLGEAIVSIKEQLHQHHGKLPASIFGLGVTVALLPFGFSSPEDLRRGKAVCEGVALKEFGSDVLAMTTLFLRELPCEIPAFVERVERFKQSLQEAV